MREPEEAGVGAEAYRDKARVLRKEAEGLSDADARTGLLFTALYYETLADQIERAEQHLLPGDRGADDEDLNAPGH